MGQTRRTLCRHFETFRTTKVAWAQITAESRLTGEITPKAKKRLAIERVRGYKSLKYVYRAAVKSVLLPVMVLDMSKNSCADVLLRDSNFSDTYLYTWKT